MNFLHARRQRAHEPYDHRSALFQHGARRTAVHLPTTGKFKSLDVENSFKAGLFPASCAIGGIQDRRGHPAVLERQHPIVLPAGGSHLDIPIGLMPKLLERQAQIEMRDIVKPRDADNFASELLDLCRCRGAAMIRYCMRL